MKTPPLRSIACGAALAWSATAVAAAGCDGVPNCQDLGSFTAAAVRVVVTKQDGVTAYQGVRTTVRFTNTGSAPLVLAYRDRSSAVSDDQGLVYRWSSGARGIGIVTRDSADAQFALAPGQSREATFDGVVQYSARRQVPGRVFTHDIVVVELQPIEGRRVRQVREHALGFAGLRSSLPGGADTTQAVNQVVEKLREQFRK